MSSKVLVSCLFGTLDFRLDIALRRGGTGTATARTSENPGCCDGEYRAD